MTASELKGNIGGYFFDRKTMQFFGDTMKNFGVRSAQIDKPVSYDESGKPLFTIKIDCWELYRKRPVKNGLSGSFYFRKDNYQQVFKALKVIESI